MATLRVIGHGNLLEIGAFLGEEHRFGRYELFRHVESGYGYRRFAAGGVTLDREAWQTAVPAIDRVSVGETRMRPQPARTLQIRCLLVRNHVKRRCRRAVADRVLHAGNPERIAGVHVTTVGGGANHGRTINYGQTADAL